MNKKQLLCVVLMTSCYGFSVAGSLHIHFHDLRHTFASWLVQADVPLYTAGALLGHASTKTTARYAHLAADGLRDAIHKIGGQ